MDHGDRRAQLRQIDRFFHRRVAAADDRDLAALEEEAVAGRAGGHATSRQLLVDAEVQPLRGGAGREDQRVGEVLGLADGDLERPLREIQRGHVTGHELGAEVTGLQPHLLHEIGPHDAVAKAGIVLDRGGQHQLAALLDTLDDQRLQVGAAGI